MEVKYWMNEYKPIVNKKFLGIGVIGIISIVIVTLFVFTMIFNVGVGEAGMVVDPLTRSISDPILGPTFGIKAPWTSLTRVP